MSTRSRANPGGMDVLKVLGADVRPIRERKPPWFKVPPPGGERYLELTKLIRDENLHTVCQEAACPNVGHIHAPRRRQRRRVTDARSMVRG